MSLAWPSPRLVPHQELLVAHSFVTLSASRIANKLPAPGCSDGTAAFGQYCANGDMERIVLLFPHFFTERVRKEDQR